MRFLKTWSTALFFVASTVLLAWSGGCSSSGSGGSLDGSVVGSSGGGTCQATCAKSCSADGDCDTSQGELCCNFGSAGKACEPAKACPRFCSQDTDCDTSMGQACELLSPRRVPQGLRACDLRHQALRVGHGLPGERPGLLRHLQAVHLHPCGRLPEGVRDELRLRHDQRPDLLHDTPEPRPEPRQRQGPLPQPAVHRVPSGLHHLGGLRLDLCADLLRRDVRRDVSEVVQGGQRLRGTDLLRLGDGVPPAAPRPLLSEGPSCKGVPSYSSCTTCGESRGCGTSCLGCAAEGGAGSCTGSPVYTTCSTCPECGINNYCTGCTQNTTGTCSGSSPCLASTTAR